MNYLKSFMVFLGTLYVVHEVTWFVLDKTGLGEKIYGGYLGNPFIWWGLWYSSIIAIAVFAGVAFLKYQEKNKPDEGQK